MELPASYTIRVYVSWIRLFVAVFWYSPVSQKTMLVSCTLMFWASVYVSWFLLQLASTLMADGVADSDV